MRLKPFLTAVTGVLVAGGSVVIAKQAMFDDQLAAEAAAAQVEFVEIYVARQEIPFGQPIEPHLVTTQKWPKEFLPVGVFADADTLFPTVEEGPRRAKGQFFVGEVILRTKVSEHGDKVTIVSKLGENTRAMAIKVDAVTAVGGFVTPGDFVDIVLTQGSQTELRAVTILQNVRVIGVDQSSEEQTDKPSDVRTVTVEVTPEQGQRLALAQKAGTLSLTLRTLDGVEDRPLDMVELRDLLQMKSPMEEDERAPTITVRRGNTAELVPLSGPASNN
ncbi:Flp pilus assembly protein CpaB [Psychromarinibacter halotolerans]|uniref:Flp pilus assembly protein CpaB n=1 Tax=Psychromarinibacter halotolerans TaxID=1775175 RepID=A0ABV7GTN0_9RHOB|nr:Flp pilus assembly protein CpaB [Psychromarinibacter halotolerans]MDF0594612.1 Flp pilus assembly protein CpaB [Psychromarinibacter halotolerans]